MTNAPPAATVVQEHVRPAQRENLLGGDGSTLWSTTETITH